MKPVPVAILLVVVALSVDRAMATDTDADADDKVQLLKRLLEELLKNEKRQAMFAAYDKTTDTVRVELQRDTATCKSGCFFKIEFYPKSDPADILDILYYTWDPNKEKHKSAYIKLTKYREIYQHYNGRPLEKDLEFRICRSNEEYVSGKPPNETHTCVKKTVDTTKHDTDLNDIFKWSGSDN